MKKSFLYIIFFICSPFVLFAQSLNIHMNDGAIHNFSISEIDSITFSGTSQLPLNGLVAYYPFNGNANDESGNGNHGNVEGATLVSDRFGTANSAYSFDGNSSRIDIGDVTFLDGKSEATISIWVKYLPHNNYVPIITKGPMVQYEASFNVIQTNPGNGDYLWTFFGGGQSLQSVSHSVKMIDDGEWHNIIVRFENKENVVYVDGDPSQSITEVTNCNSIQNISDHLFFGYNKRADGEYWYNGLIDDVRIYDRALNESEINLLSQ